VRAVVLPCCLKVSGCYECLKQLTVCPSCDEAPLKVQDLVFNHSLDKAASWYQRQQMSRMKTEEIESYKNSVVDDKLVEQLLGEAKEEASKRVHDVKPTAAPPAVLQ
jgi:hypothetical protein